MDKLARCLFFVFFFCHLISVGQYYNLGQNPSKTKWQQINTADFQLIFPADFEANAKKLANILTYANKKARITLKTKPHKISIILQNNTTVDNGFVTLAPKRSEFYATPSQENEGADWLKKLAVHEYRHVVQIEKFNEGVGKALYIMFGEQGMGALLLATTPLWFMEGDAVVTETRHTERGRGNYGPFLKYFKAQLLEYDTLSYDKASFGSFKNFVTDHYKLGYFLNDYVNNKYGEPTWDSLMHCVVRNPFVPYPFSYHLKKITGKNTNQIYRDMYFYLKEKWGAEKHAPSTKTQQKSPKLKEYESHSMPLPINDSTYLFVRQSFDFPLKIAQLKNNKITNIHTPSRFDGDGWDYKNGLIAWTEKRSHPRWQYLDYSELILYNLVKHKKKRVKRKTRWFYPQFHPTKNILSAIEVDKSNQFKIITLDYSGERISTVYSSANQLYHPTWANDSTIIFVELNNGVSQLKSIDTKSREIQLMLKSPHPISFIQPYKKGVIAQASVNGKDKVVWIKNNKMFEVMDPEFGLNFPQVLNNKLAFADYHVNGYQVVETSIKIGNEITLQQDWSDMVFTDVPNDTFPIQKFRPLLHLFNLHSWAPLSIYPDEQDAQIGLSLFSQNLLSSSVATFNIDYNTYTQATKYSANYSLSHFYPTFFVDWSKSYEPNSVVQGVSTNFESQEFRLGTSLRHRYDGSKWRKSFLIRGTYGFTENDYNFSAVYKDTVQFIENVQLVAGFTIAHKAAQNDMYAPWSISLTAAGFENIKANQHTQFVNISATTPGIFKNDGLQLIASKQWANDFFAPNYLQDPRGVLNQSYKDGERFSIQYEIPLFYPDLKIGPILYIQRIRANVFYDYLSVDDTQKTNILFSKGSTLFFDFNPFRYSYLSSFSLEIGVNNNNQFFLNPGFRVNY